ncbi:PD-(D/E)XK nuclease family protein [Halocatena salina]|uniref:PD-(D/E)XK nuclease family protein n=1 Tax=Halocatena salina TaxID=2934340 RepID=A0A8U0AA66_9EURY|nr:PD-(D/E)XK nuclease family protein [Halocatena salina]UPM45328.1 PD-(D/E)XK nuclease family protein [Halocatena salina]
MNATLLTGPQHARLEQQAFQQADALADDSLGSILYITRNDARRSHVEDAWAEAHRPLRLRAETLDAVVREWYEALEGPVARLSSQVNRRLTEYALDRATAGDESIFAGEPASGSLVDAFSHRFSLFDDAGVTTPDALATAFDESILDERIATATVDIYQCYRELHQTAGDEWTATRGELFQTVATTEVSLSELSPDLDTVIISGYHEFRPVERAVLARIVDAFDTIAILPLHQHGDGGVDAVTHDGLAVYETLGFNREVIEPQQETARAIAAVTNALYRHDLETVSHPSTLYWRELPTPEREIRFVARELRMELAAGRNPDDLAVVIPGTESYAGYVEDIFDIYEIPHVTTAATQLDETFVGSVVHDLLKLAEADPYAENLTSLLANSLVDIFPQEQVDAITRAARRRDTVALAPLLETIDGDATAFVKELVASLKPLRTGDIGTALDVLRRVLAEDIELDTAVKNYAGSTPQAREQQAYSVVDDILSSFEELQAISNDYPPLALLARAFDSVSVRVPQSITGGHVEVMGMLDARMRSFEHVFVVGLTTEHFPASPERPAFFDAMTDAHPRFDTGDGRRRGRYLFATLLANSEEVTLTTPDTGDGEAAVVRSPVLDELQRVTGIEPETGVDDRVGSREDLQRHLAAHPDRRAAVDHAGKQGDLSPEQTKRTDRGLVCAANRSTAELTPHDGILDADTVDTVYPPTDRAPYSASRIERYVECGFKFYAENVIGIEDHDEIEVRPTPLEAGSYVHDVLERFYVDLLGESDDDIEFMAYDKADLEQHLLDVALDELEQADFEYEGLFYERWLTELFAGLGKPETNPYSNSDRPHTAPAEGLFATFLTEERSRDPAKRQWFEAPFGAGLPDSESGRFDVERSDGSTVSIRGYIDRIDVNGNGEHAELALYDYKTGRTPYMTKTTGGTKFQLPIYLLAADTVVDENLTADAALSATYYQVHPPNDVTVRRGVESKFESQAALRRFLNNVVPEWLGNIDDAIANGRFHTSLLSARSANCNYCEYRRACDVRHHQKRQRVEQAQADDASYVPLRVQDEADLTAVMSDD